MKRQEVIDKAQELIDEMKRVKELTGSDEVFDGDPYYEDCYVDSTLSEVEKMAKEVTKEDVVNHPSHYTSGKFEVIEYIKDQLTEEEFRGYIKGNLIKYISRERHKNGDEDLKKAEFYLHYLMKGK